jgi:hypothetical protein
VPIASHVLRESDSKCSRKTGRFLMDPHIQHELERGDEQTARLRKSAAALRAGAGETAETFGLVGQDEFRAMVLHESRRCDLIDDALTLVEVRCKPPLEPDTESAFVKSMHELIARPGDLLGRLSTPGHYGLAFPWTQPHEGRALAMLTVDHLVKLAPDHHIEAGFYSVADELSTIPQMHMSVQLNDPTLHQSPNRSARR